MKFDSKNFQSTTEVETHSKFHIALSVLMPCLSEYLMEAKFGMQPDMAQYYKEKYSFCIL
jgi:hypothetical protein